MLDRSKAVSLNYQLSMSNAHHGSIHTRAAQCVPVLTANHWVTVANTVLQPLIGAFIKEQLRVFVTDEDLRGRNVLSFSLYRYVKAHKLSSSYHTVAWASTTSSAKRVSE